MESGKEIFKVYMKSGDEVKYDFPRYSLDKTEKAVYDEKKLLSPRLTKFDTGLGLIFHFTYDELGRLQKRKEDYTTETIEYKSGTTLKEKIIHQGMSLDYSSYKIELSHEYDERGNLTSINDGRYRTDYTYNAINQLTKEKCVKLTNGAEEYIREYSYDESGNLTEVVSDGESEKYTYDENGRLTNVDGRGTINYDDYGNPTSYFGKPMTWHRGSLLKSYNGYTYDYDGHGKLSKKTKDGDVKEEFVYDGDKLICLKKNGSTIEFFYDLEGVAGFKYNYKVYTYLKDGQGNIIGITHDGYVSARYIYDAWGNCEVTKADGSAISDERHAALVNPFRWKSQYYDTDSGLYWIGERWYDPEVGRYISPDNPETLLQNATVVYGLNLYAFCIENPIAVMIAANTFLPSLDLYYNGEYKTWWEKYGKWLLFGIGVTATIIACIAAPFTCGASTAVSAIGTTLLKIAMNAAVGAVVSLAIGGAVAGVISAFTGHGFWQAFGDSVSENFAEAVVTSFAFSAVSTAASNLIQLRQCFKEGTLVETEDGLKPIEEIEVDDLVLSYDEETQKQVYKPVKRLFRNETKEWYHIFVNGEEIVCTPGHPFYVIGKGFIPAKELKADDLLQLADNTAVFINKIIVERLEEAETTYNFEVADFHTYYVSDSKVLVHNTCRKEWTKERKRYWKEQGEKYKNSINKNELAESGKYKLSKENIAMMRKGKAPIGIDGKSVNLHHVNGINADPFNYIELTRTEHFSNFKELHSFLFNK